MSRIAAAKLCPSGAVDARGERRGGEQQRVLHVGRRSAREQQVRERRQREEVGAQQELVAEGRSDALQERYMPNAADLCKSLGSNAALVFFHDFQVLPVIHPELLAFAQSKATKAHAESIFARGCRHTYRCLRSIVLVASSQWQGFKGARCFFSRFINYKARACASLHLRALQAETTQTQTLACRTLRSARGDRRVRVTAEMVTHFIGKRPRMRAARGWP
ncbi:hypothetical protein B0H17DRAFT_1220956 [Mycena rosella]|uniref:Uncharacterized protein n=1 Tax=Mycena rosella TaxID=1033263 RepID=A0AAD7B7P6_MYCRO|nr:hypothetical protein B0H17DRAFT_1220956 [Mycena rosella]